MSSDGAARRVLVADDEDAIRMLVAHTLRLAGFDTVEASDGREAIQKLESGRFSALVLDLMMPHVDGFGVVDHLLKSQPRMVKRTVLLTAYPDVAEQVEALCCVVRKPFEINYLIDIVRRCAEA